MMRYWRLCYLLIPALAGLLWACGYLDRQYVQVVDLTPMEKLVLPRNVERLYEFLPLGIHGSRPEFVSRPRDLLVTNAGTNEVLGVKVPGGGDLEIRVEIRMWPTVEEARMGFRYDYELWLREWRRPTVFGGMGDTRYCKSYVKKERDGIYGHGWPSGNYASLLIIQKRNVVIKIDELGPDRRASVKDEVIRVLADAMERSVLACGDVD